MSLAEALERAASELASDAEAIRPANGDPVRLLELLEPEAATRVLAWLLTHEPDEGAQLALDWAEQEAGARALQAVADDVLPKAGRKALRRAQHRLRSRGVDISASSPSEQVVARLPQLEETLALAFVSAFDPRGVQLVHLVEPNPAGGARLFEILLDDSRGVVQFELYNSGRTQVRRFLKEIVRRETLAAVKADPEAVRARISQVVRCQPKDRPLPRGFAEWRNRIAAEPEERATPGQQAELALGKGSLPGALQAAAELVMKGDLGPWPPERAQLETLIHGLQEQAESRLIVSGTRRRERLDAALEEAGTELYRGEFAQQTATRFRESSYLLWKAGREDDARACLEAARNFSDPQPGGNPVARALLEVALAPLLKSLRESKDGEEEESLLVKP